MLAESLTHYTDGGIPEAAKRPIDGLDQGTRFHLSLAADDALRIT